MITKAMKLALEALRLTWNSGMPHPDIMQVGAAIAAIEALAEQPAPVKQEPVVFYRCNGCGHAYEQMHPTSCDCMEGSSFEQVNYYTSPQPAQRTLVRLTDEEIEKVWDSGIRAFFLLARALEAKFMEKNT